jgi:hypothetical protein
VGNWGAHKRNWEQTNAVDAFEVGFAKTRRFISAFISEELRLSKNRVNGWKLG